MSRSFKCCKKDFSSFICSCLSVFHPSCLERQSGATKLGGYRIYCSESCSKVILDNEEREKRVNDELSRLEKEIEERESYIKRQRRQSQVFEEDVSLAEEKFTATIDSQAQRIEAVKLKIVEINGKNEELLKELSILNELKCKHLSDLHDLTKLNRSMTITIETLEKDNDVCNKEIKSLKQRIDELQHTMNTWKRNGDKGSGTNGEGHLQPGNDFIMESGKSSKKSLDVSCGPPTFSSCSSRRRILIVGRDVRGYLSLFKKLTHRHFDINCQMVTTSSLEDLLQCACACSRTFGKHDFVFMFGECFKSVQGHGMDREMFRRYLERMSNTNVTIVGSPLDPNNRIVNRTIASQNREMIDCLGKTNMASFIPLMTCFPAPKDYIVEYLVDSCIFPEGCQCRTCVPRDFLRTRASLNTSSGLVVGGVSTTSDYAIHCKSLDTPSDPNQSLYGASASPSSFLTQIDRIPPLP